MFARERFKMYSGQAYKSRTGKKTMKGREIRPPCLENCYLKCATRMSQEDREKVYNEYYGYANIEKQRRFIAMHVEYIKGTDNKTSNPTRGLNLAYYLTINGTRLRVCKRMFRGTLDISDKIPQSALRFFDTHGNKLRDDLRGGNQYVRD